MIAVISDIHGNLTALNSVLDHMNNPDSIIFCGDVVGYGPKPRECLRLVEEKADYFVSGNHDRIVLTSRTYNSESAREGIRHSKANLHNRDFEWLSSIPREIEEEIDDRSLRVIHSHPDPSSIKHVHKDEIREEFGGYLDTDILIYGHTHVPVNQTYEDCLVLNPGSVGQPRDSDSRASYATIDLESLNAEIHRVEYDISETEEAIEEANLPKRTAQRLYNGN